jgi:hypothetical protein
MRAVNPEAVALVFGARLVEIGAEEFARLIGDGGDAAAHRGAVHMAGKDIHEDRYAQHFRIAQSQLFRRKGRACGRNNAVGGADDEPVIGWRDARRVAEEIDAPQGQRDAEPEQEVGDEAKKQCRNDKGGDEGPALPMDRDQCPFDGINNAHRPLRMSSSLDR